MPKKKLSKEADVSAEISDPRFSSISTDPRFRLPSKKLTRTKIDKRFSRMLTDDDFCNSAIVDRYGRRVDGKTKKKALERLYLPVDDEEKEDTTESEPETELPTDANFGISTELNTPKNYDPARGGGFSSSDDQSDEDDSGGVNLDEQEFPDLQAAQMKVEMGDVTPRFAVVNLDWDNIKSTDLFAVFSSFLPAGGKIHKISIYPSEFGKERMDREELEGPPREIFVQKHQEDSLNESSDDDEKIARSLQKPDDGVEYKDSALRQYQLERLRYFYAVVICSSGSVAKALYDATDGREYLSSANFLDLRFIPDGVEFENKPRDECTELLAGYRPTEFITTALQHSKVKLTWDTEPNEACRKEIINRAFSSAPAAINENDLRAYIGSDSESDLEPPESTDLSLKLSKKDISRQKIRSALGLTENGLKSKSEKSSALVGEMEVTFTAGLSGSRSGGVFQNEPSIEETTAERYVRLERERKARRKERAKASRETRDLELEEKNKQVTDIAELKKSKNTGFDDTFFTEQNDTSSRSSKKMSQRKVERLSSRGQESGKEKAQLELLIEADNSANSNAVVDHFDIKEIMRAEKDQKSKKRKKRSNRKNEGLQASFQMDVHDPRFEKVFDSHEYAIDPSNPRFKATDAMKMLLEEGRRKRNSEEHNGVDTSRKKIRGKGEESQLNSLVEKIKKSKQSE